MKYNQDSYINYVELGKRMKSLRVSHHMTHSELAALLNISASHISNIESGNARISLHTLIKIADYFDVSTDYLLRNTQKKYSDPDQYLLQNIFSKCTEEQLILIKTALDNIHNIIM